MRAPHDAPARKSVIITGGNAGLGYQCARSIAMSDREWHIIIAARNLEKTADAINRLREETNNANFTGMECDLVSLSSVRKFASLFQAKGLPPLHAIVCNAGLQITTETMYTEDGFEMTFGVNHLGHFLLVNLLMKYMAEPGRIVFVSSGTHDPEQVTGMPAPVYTSARLLAYPDTASSGESDPPIGRRRYSTSKLCNIYCAYELADRIRRETGRKITVNAFDPGLMPGTGLARQVKSAALFVWKYILPVITLLPINAHTPRKSGKALASLVTDTVFRDVTGRYFEGTRERKSSMLSYSKINAKDLWDTSVELARLSESESVLQ